MWSARFFTFNFVSSPKMEKEENSRSVVNNGKLKFHKLSTVFVNIAYHLDFITTHIQLYIKNTYAAKSI